MKKIFIITVFLLFIFTAFSQDVRVVSFATDTTMFRKSIPNKTFIIIEKDSSLYQLTEGAAPIQCLRTSHYNKFTGAIGATGPTGATGAVGATGADGALNAWSLLGSSGTSPVTNFIGTTDEDSLLIKVNNSTAVVFDQANSYQKFGFSKSYYSGFNILTPPYLARIIKNGSFSKYKKEQSYIDNMGSYINLLTIDTVTGDWGGLTIENFGVFMTSNDGASAYSNRLGIYDYGAETTTSNNIVTWRIETTGYMFTPLLRSQNSLGNEHNVLVIDTTSGEHISVPLLEFVLKGDTSYLKTTGGDTAYGDYKFNGSLSAKQIQIDSCINTVDNSYKYDKLFRLNSGDSLFLPARISAKGDLSITTVLTDSLIGEANFSVYVGGTVFLLLNTDNIAKKDTASRFCIMKSVSVSNAACFKNNLPYPLWVNLHLDFKTGDSLLNNYYYPNLAFKVSVDTSTVVGDTAVNSLSTISYYGDVVFMDNSTSDYSATGCNGIPSYKKPTGIVAAVYAGIAVPSSQQEIEFISVNRFNTYSLGNVNPHKLRAYCEGCYVGDDNLEGCMDAYIATKDSVAFCFTGDTFYVAKPTLNTWYILDVIITEDTIFIYRNNILIKKKYSASPLFTLWTIDGSDYLSAANGAANYESCFWAGFYNELNSVQRKNIYRMFDKLYNLP